jgi:hypothetical protein
MKPLRVILGIAAVSFALPTSWAQGQGQGSCAVAVRASVEVAGNDFSLADLLGSDTCAELRQAAAGVRIGRPPLAGSSRVMTGNEVRGLLQKAMNIRENNSIVLNPLQVPERVTLRRAGPRASCAEIMARILSAPVTHSSLPEIDLTPGAPTKPDRDGACGAGDRIALDAPLALTRTAWNPALATWDVSARCVHAADCVPFFVRMPERNSRFEKRSASHSTAAKTTVMQKPLVRPGETVTLLWDQGGIRLVVPAVCLDKGTAGEAVRARIVRGGRMVRAVVESAGRLRVAS